MGNLLRRQQISVSQKPTPFSFMKLLHGIVVEGEAAIMREGHLHEIIICDVDLFRVKIARSRSWRFIQQKLTAYGFTSRKNVNDQWILSNDKIVSVNDILTIQRYNRTSSNFYMIRLRELVEKGDVAYMNNQKIVIPDIDIFLNCFKQGLKFKSFQRQLHHYEFTTRTSEERVIVWHKSLESVNSISKITKKKI